MYLGVPQKDHLGVHLMAYGRTSLFPGWEKSHDFFPTAACSFVGPSRGKKVGRSRKPEHFTAACPRDVLSNLGEVTSCEIYAMKYSEEVLQRCKLPQ